MAESSSGFEALADKERSSQASSISDWWGRSDTRNNPLARINPAASGSRSYSPQSTGDTRTDRKTPTGPRANLVVSRALILVTSVLIMIGSVTPWVTATILGRTVSVKGTDTGISNAIGVNGWITFIAGVVLLVIGALMLVSGETSLRGLAALAAATSLGVGIYCLVRILHELSKARASASRFGPLGRSLVGNTSIGFGLIMLLVAAVVALGATVAEARAS